MDFTIVKAVNINVMMEVTSKVNPVAECNSEWTTSAGGSKGHKTHVSAVVNLDKTSKSDNKRNTKTQKEKMLAELHRKTEEAVSLQKNCLLQ